jgi:hypothetical protein
MIVIVLVLLAGCGVSEDEAAEAPAKVSAVSTPVATRSTEVASDDVGNASGAQPSTAIPGNEDAANSAGDDVADPESQDSTHPSVESTTSTVADNSEPKSTSAGATGMATDEGSRSPDPEPEEVSSAAPSPEVDSTPTTSFSIAPVVTLAPRIPSAQSPTSDSTTTTTVRTPSPPEGEFVVLEVPPGTLDRIEAGDPVEDVLPPLTVARVGQTLIFRNLDSGTHFYGPVTARAGETIRWKLTSAGEFIGYCTAGDSRVVTLQVLEK